MTEVSFGYISSTDPELRDEIAPMMKETGRFKIPETF
jgi:hypothetical protein